MSKKIGLIILVVLALSLTACVRAVPQAATQAVATNGNLPVALGTPTGMAGLELLGTQTAQALSGTPAATTPADALATLTPVGQAPAAVVDTPMPTPVPAVVVPQATVETTKPGTYALKEGEFPYCIARRFNVDPDQLLSLNGLSNGQTFYAGLTLKIPATGNPFPGSRAFKAHPAQHTVRAGDTVYSVACQFGDVDPVNIAAVNGLAAPYKLTVGAAIQIP